MAGYTNNRTDDKSSAVSVSTRRAFWDWLIDGNAKMSTPEVILSCLDKVSQFAVEKKMSSVSFWLITQLSVFGPIYKQLLKTNLRRPIDRKTSNTFPMAGSYYIKFLKENSYAFVLPLDNHLNEETVPTQQPTALPETQQSRIIHRVDFKNTELCTDCNPVTCSVNGESIPVGGSWRDLLINLAEMFLVKDNSKVGDLFQNPLLPGSNRPFFLQSKPNGAAKQISTGQWIYVNFNIATLVDIIGKLCRYCGVNLENVDITYTPKLTGDIVGKTVTQSDNDTPIVDVPDPLLNVLCNDYINGFRFDITALRLLSNKAGVEIDDTLQAVLKKTLFHRGDDVYFVLDNVADYETRKDLIEYTNTLLEDFGCFETLEIYRHYNDRVNTKCILNEDVFELFYEFISNRDDVRIVAIPNMRNKIARQRTGSAWDLLTEVANRITRILKEDFNGTITEEDLHMLFRAFSTDLLTKIIKHCAEEIVRTEINGIVVYQSLDALGLMDDFSQLLEDVLGRFSELGIAPTEDNLHTALSLELGVNFNSEYNIPDQETYRRLISAYYKAEPPRKWKSGIFSEVSD